MNRERGRVTLASASPRRRALLEGACYEVDVCPSGVEERWPGGDIASGAVALATQKAAAVATDTQVVVAADTLVVLDQKCLEKPVDAADAARMLRALSNRQHQVVTGFVVRHREQIRTGAVFTSVSFRCLSDAEIERYVATGEPFDKAGAYGIQGDGFGFVDRVEGSYTNIVGLPVKEVLAAIEAIS